MHLINNQCQQWLSVYAKTWWAREHVGDIVGIFSFHFHFQISVCTKDDQNWIKINRLDILMITIEQQDATPPACHLWEEVTTHLLYNFYRVFLFFFLHLFTAEVNPNVLFKNNCLEFHVSAPTHSKCLHDVSSCKIICNNLHPLYCRESLNLHCVIKACYKTFAYCAASPVANVVSPHSMEIFWNINCESSYCIYTWNCSVVTFRKPQIAMHCFEIKTKRHFRFCVENSERLHNGAKWNHFKSTQHFEELLFTYGNKINK